MKIVVDENIPCAKAVFSKLGDVFLLPGRAIDVAAVRDATALIVRSVTPVGAALLKGSRVQFVGTATAGVNHIDQDYLKTQNIFFASAAGANADSVAEYVLSALFSLATKTGEGLSGKRLGIIGAGHIGSRVDRMARAIGITTVLNDPPLERESGDSIYRPFQEALDADFITLHVPLSRSGPDKTELFFDAKVLSKLAPSTVIINTARGEVIESRAFLRALARKKLAEPVFDVWPNEPEIDWHLLNKVALGTPHIAGYALEGKIGGTLMIYETLCAALGTRSSGQLQRALLPDKRIIQANATGKTDFDILSEILSQACNIQEEDCKLRALLDIPIQKRAAGFDKLRKSYPVRRSFQGISLVLENGSATLKTKLRSLGFSVSA